MVRTERRAATLDALRDGILKVAEVRKLANLINRDGRGRHGLGTRGNHRQYSTRLSSSRSEA